MKRPSLFPPPPRTFALQIRRLDLETAARLRDHGTARSFQLHAAPPATYEAAPLFTPEPEPEQGPAPMRGQTALETA